MKRCIKCIAEFVQLLDAPQHKAEVPEVEEPHAYENGETRRQGYSLSAEKSTSSKLDNCIYTPKRVELGLLRNNNIRDFGSLYLW